MNGTVSAWHGLCSERWWSELLKCTSKKVHFEKCRRRHRRLYPVKEPESVNMRAGLTLPIINHIKRFSRSDQVLSPGNPREVRDARLSGLWPPIAYVR